MNKLSKVKKAALVTLVIASIAANLIFYSQVNVLQSKVTQVNAAISGQVERNIRRSMRYTQELRETESPEAMENLKRSLEELGLGYTHWLELNQTERRPNTRMARGFAGVEALRNTLAHHLYNQYVLQENTLSDYDFEVLDRSHDLLDRLLLAYHNIENRLDELQDPEISDGGLGQIVNNIEEMAKLYRHSRSPNTHLQYQTYEEIVEIAEEFLPMLKEHTLLEENQEVKIREGVHFYKLDYTDGDEIVYTLWMDAVDGKIRNYELKRLGDKNENLTKIEALQMAEEFLNTFYTENFLTEVFEMKNGQEDKLIYAFRFTAIREDVEMISDALDIHINAKTGEIVKLSNDFIDSNIPYYWIDVAPEEIIESEEEKEELSIIEYRGKALIRSFETRYHPRVVHSFLVIEREQPMLAFYDLTTGRRVYQMHYIYEAMQNGNGNNEENRNEN
ncbi:Propeptide, PepSY amd peptidase M4 [Alkaliphilus metalliredigens QYMF]|uniref:Propeptide, PepSY amd peptidase M4 n=1 Tax=Alkaliphilus metalliredigens (strain QYMF) TaxID=293826 RepID=A6TLI6_ALKMQ|nr:PepSY domain-containing protein [Alkaliphilus metalliredigens]ABR47054.1 Propeptide, PepSY amd peptidase M4 [Alkaliphilus metalliredigens QYMF]